MGMLGARETMCLYRGKRELVAPGLDPHRGVLCPQAGKLLVETNTLFEKDLCSRLVVLTIS